MADEKTVPQDVKVVASIKLDEEDLNRFIAWVAIEKSKDNRYERNSTYRFERNNGVVSLDVTWPKKENELEVDA